MPTARWLDLEEREEEQRYSYMQVVGLPGEGDPYKPGGMGDVWPEAIEIFKQQAGKADRGDEPSHTHMISLFLLPSSVEKELPFDDQIRNKKALQLTREVVWRPRTVGS